MENMETKQIEIDHTAFDIMAWFDVMLSKNKLSRVSITILCNENYPTVHQNHLLLSHISCYFNMKQRKYWGNYDHEIDHNESIDGVNNVTIDYYLTETVSEIWPIYLFK